MTLKDSRYIRQIHAHPYQTAPFGWVNMNALTVLSVAALAACSSGQIVGYPGLFGYPGLLPAASPITFKAAETPITLKTTPITLNAVAPTPLSYSFAPVAAVAPVAPVQTQYHAQSELGEYAFGFAGGPSSRDETRDAFGVVRGSYNYIDSEGKIQTQHYVADALGFRVAGTNLPVAPEAPVAEPLALPGPLPEPVQDTPEVAEARAAFKIAFDEAAAAAAAATPETARSRRKRAIIPSPLRFSYGFSSPLTYNYPAVVRASPLQYTATAASPAFATYAHGLPVAAPVPVTTYSAVAAAPRDAELLSVTNNPGHAVSYRVY
ncbi:hypothetical protein SK128_016381 [Halocaridina rubra]|uniref:Cuticle protein n=1 Tax=Halocaridina rubra TaxID=373956 RepID=A0AAN8XU82_HALRR